MTSNDYKILLGIWGWFADTATGKVCDLVLVTFEGRFNIRRRCLALAGPPKIGGGALIPDVALNQANTVSLLKQRLQGQPAPTISNIFFLRAIYFVLVGVDLISNSP